MRYMVLPIATLSLTACATTGANFAAKEPSASYTVASSPAEVADCITLNTPGLYTPIRTGGTASVPAVTIGWRQEPSGQVATWTITPKANGSTVEVRRTGLIGRHIEKVRKCYGA